MSETTPRPSGTVTFLFTDIEGSTRLWETVPEAMRVALARHDALLRALIEANSGYIFKTVGDAFCASFARPAGAVHTAAEIQRALAAEDWGAAAIRVRIGLHTGETEERDGDYFGPAVNRVARLMALGAGGQILLSSVTAALVHGSLPPGLCLENLGPHRLKDLPDPDDIHQASVEGLRTDFPSLHGQDRYRHNLPTLMSSFIGRESEIAVLAGLIPRSRLTTLTGTGGSGKTRLALQAGGELIERFPEGIWLVDLAPLTDPFLVPLEIAGILGVREETTSGLPDQIATVIGQRSVLLILDNCEHLLNACAALASRLLRSCLGLRILATSREAFGIVGESLFPVEPFHTPDPGAEAASLATNDCVRLFAERATAALPSFRLGAGNIRAVAHICARLDGIPLALELAAARTRVLSPEQILARLDDRFRLLIGGDRAALRRQQTLRDLIAWSYDLLAEEERHFFRSLSVFSTSWDLEAAEQVCGASGDAAKGAEACYADALDLLEELVVKSLVVADEGPEGTRFRMLESIREYARVLLAQHGEEEVLRARHASLFLKRAERLSLEINRPSQAASLAAGKLDASNFLTAFDYFAEAGDGDKALRLAVALEWFHYRIGKLGESRKALETALSLTSGDGPTALRAEALVSLGWKRFAQGELEVARDAYTEGLSTSRAVGERRVEARALTGLGVTLRWMGDRAAGIALGEEGVAAGRSSGDELTLVRSIIWAYATLDGVFDGEPRLAELEEGLALARRIGERWSEGHLLDGIGDLLRVQGRHVEARGKYEGSLVIFREQGDRFLESFVLDGMAKNELAAGRVRDSLPVFAESLRLMMDFGLRTSGVESLAWMATAEALLGELVPAARLFGAFEATSTPGERDSLCAHYPALRDAKARAESAEPDALSAGRCLGYEAAALEAFLLAADV